MVSLNRTVSSDANFISLVSRLDDELEVRDGEDHEFYRQFNSLTHIKQCILAYKGKASIGCGAIKVFDEFTMEVKRMYVLPEYRGKGIAAKILSELETWTKELGFSQCILETGFNQPEAIAHYKKCGYRISKNYGQYIGIEKSICFEKKL